MLLCNFETKHIIFVKYRVALNLETSKIWNALMLIPIFAYYFVFVTSDDNMNPFAQSFLNYTWDSVILSYLNSEFVISRFDFKNVSLLRRQSDM